MYKSNQKNRYSGQKTQWIMSSLIDLNLIVLYEFLYQFAVYTTNHTKRSHRVHRLVLVMMKPIIWRGTGQPN